MSSDFVLNTSGTDGGGRTHTSVKTLDFESSASANSATSATAPENIKATDEVNKFVTLGNYRRKSFDNDVEKQVEGRANHLFLPQGDFLSRCWSNFFARSKRRNLLGKIAKPFA